MLETPISVANNKTDILPKEALLTEEKKLCRVLTDSTANKTVIKATFIPCVTNDCHKHLGLLEMALSF